MNNEDKGEKTMESSAALNFGGLDSMFDDMFTPAPQKTVDDSSTAQKIDLIQAELDVLELYEFDEDW